jgi:hypothetical protein
MEGLGDLLGGYGSEELSDQENRKSREDEGEDGLDLAHLIGASTPPPEPEEEEDLGPMQGPAPGPQLEHYAEENDHNEQAAARRRDHGATTSAGGTLDHRPEEPSSYPELADRMPPELAAPPPGECDPDVQARVARWLALQARGRRLTDELRSSRDYRNPEFFRKMVEYWEIDEYGTCFPPSVFDPGGLPMEDRADALRAEWEAGEERRKAARATAGLGERFVHGGGQQHPAAAGTAAAVAQAQARAVALAASMARR